MPAMEIHSAQAGSSSSQSQTSSTHSVNKTKHNVETFTTDIELDGTSDGVKDANELDNAINAKELIPTEALKWNVDGDQSPCKQEADGIEL
jgi:hypothetical protein